MGKVTSAKKTVVVTHLCALYGGVLKPNTVVFKTTDEEPNNYFEQFKEVYSDTVKALYVTCKTKNAEAALSEIKLNNANNCIHEHIYAMSITKASNCIKVFSGESKAHKWNCKNKADDAEEEVEDADEKETGDAEEPPKKAGKKASSKKTEEEAEEEEPPKKAGKKASSKKAEEVEEAEEEPPKKAGKKASSKKAEPSDVDEPPKKVKSAKSKKEEVHDDDDNDNENDSDDRNENDNEDDDADNIPAKKKVVTTAKSKASSKGK